MTLDLPLAQMSVAIRLLDAIHLQVDGFHRLLIKRFLFALSCLFEDTSIDS